MKSSNLRRTVLVLALSVAGLWGLSGCSKQTVGALVANKPPTVELTNAPVSKDASNPYFYSYKVNWSGNDPDGRIDHYEYAIDPPKVVVRDTTQCNDGDTCWVLTTKNEETLTFRATQPDPIKGTAQPTASDPHTFVIKAVDNAGAQSPRKNRSFYAYTVAPSVAITNPTPSKLLSAKVSPSVRMEWEGHDPDGQKSQKPVQYKFKMLDLDDTRNQVFLANPDSLRRQESVRNWAGWDSTSADTQFVQFTNLTPGKSYLFVLIGFDEAGAYSPVFSLDSNCLWLQADLASSNGPLIHMFNQYIDFTYQSGGYTTDPLRWINLEVPTKVRVDVNWDAIARPGSHIQYFRWMVDGNINDELPRTDQQEDYIHWSRPDPTMPNGVSLRPFTDGEHFFYLECADNNGQKSLGVMHLIAVTPAFNRNLLVIDDTRLEVDKFQGDPVFKRIPDVYTKPWPSRTEMDTFLFARGGFPWRGTKNPTSGVISTPGLLAGYDYDTLGTRLGLENPARGVLLSKIGSYKSLIWLVDDVGAQYQASLDQTVFPITSLWAMSGPGLASTLAAYTQLGGRVWMAGGGAAYASLQQFDKRGNNVGQTTVFSSLPQFGELVPSRIMYDGAHWQSTVAVTKSGIETLRNDYALHQNDPNSIQDPTFVVVNPWSHHDFFTGGTISSPNYSRLPQTMRPKLGIDPMPPTRLASQTTLFYPTSYPCEYIRDLNAILEDVDPDPEVDVEKSVMDTLYEARGVVLLTNEVGRFVPAPTMTYYHGRGAHQFVFTGFGMWNYAKQDCLDLIDFVLHDIWGMNRNAAIDRGSVSPLMRSPAPPPPTRTASPSTRTVSVRVPPSTPRE